MSHELRRRANVMGAALCLMWAVSTSYANAADKLHDLVFRNGYIVDGSGRPGYAGDDVIDADRISYVGTHKDFHARTEIDVKGQAIAPGFINMLAHPEESLFADGRALSD